MSTSTPVDSASTGESLALSHLERPSMTSHETSLLEALPLDLVETLLNYLDIPDRLRLSRTCKSIRRIYQSSKALQYDFVRITNGYLDMPADIEYISLETSEDEAEPNSECWSSGHVPGMEHPDPDSVHVDHHDDLDHVRRAVQVIPSVTYYFPRPPTTDFVTWEPAAAGPSTATRTITSAGTSTVTLPDASPVDKMNHLQAQESSWDTLKARTKRFITIKGPEGVYELQEGILLMCDGYRTVGHMHRPFSIRLIPLPSASDPNVEHSVIGVKSHQVNFAIADLTMDPTQDLIVVSEDSPAGVDGPTHRYHLLTLSTCQPHPLAATAFLDSPPGIQEGGLTRQLLQIMGDTLVISVARYQFNFFMMAAIGGPGIPGALMEISEEEVICWNWRSGKVLARMEPPTNDWFSSLALLTPTTFMITSSSSISPLMGENDTTGPVFPPVISIYSFASDPKSKFVPSQPLGSVYTDDTTPRPVLIAQLELPRLAPNVTIESFDVRPDPAFPVPKGNGGVGQKKAYTQDPEKGVLVFEFKVNEPPHPVLDPSGHRRKVGFELFVLRETLVDIAKEGEERLKRMREDQTTCWRVEKTYPWKEWGMDGSRFMDISMTSRPWVCSCSGYRYVNLEPVRRSFDEAPLRRPATPFAEGDPDLDVFGASAAPWHEPTTWDQPEPAAGGDVDMDQTSVEALLDMAIAASEDHDVDVTIDDQDGETIFEGEEPEAVGSDDGSNDGSVSDWEDEPPGIGILGGSRNIARRHIRVLDFSPLRLRRPLGKDSKGAMVSVHTHPTVLSKRRIWAEDVVTRLPFTEVIRKETVMANGVMIDDQRVIAIKTFEQDRNRSSDHHEMTVYCM